MGLGIEARLLTSRLTRRGSPRPIPHRELRACAGDPCSHPYATPGPVGAPSGVFVFDETSERRPRSRSSSLFTGSSASRRAFSVRGRPAIWVLRTCALYALNCAIGSSLVRIQALAIGLGAKDSTDTRRSNRGGPSEHRPAGMRFRRSTDCGRLGARRTLTERGVSPRTPPCASSNLDEAIRAGRLTVCPRRAGQPRGGSEEMER